MNLQKFLKATEKVIVDNSPTIMTAIGVTGTITTAILAGQASFKAARILEDQKPRAWETAQNGVEDLTRREKFEVVWKLYIPAAGMGGVTVFAIISANRIGMRRAAAMAAAYSISEKAFSEYKDKVVEHIGSNKEQKVRDEIAQDRVNRHDMPEGDRVIVTETGITECYDSMTDRYWPCDMERLRRAQNDINFKILREDFATLTDYYQLVGLKKTSESDELGWNTDKQLELHFTATLKEVEGKPTVPVMVVDFATVPIRDPWRFC